MLDPGQAAEIAGRYSLGSDAAVVGPVARGELGRVWRLSTSLGTWAVKEPSERASEPDAREDAAYQDAVLAAHIPIPPVVLTVDGDVLADLGQVQVRVYGWIDLFEPNINLDPVEVGTIVASIHRVRFFGRLPVHPWYTEPVGSDRWDELVRSLTASSAPFAGRLAELRDELAALEGLLEPPAELQTCHRDLWADNLRSTPSGNVCVIDWENSGLADPRQELALVLFEFGSTPERAHTLYEAYVDNGGPGRIGRPSDFSMVIAQLGHIGERACRIWLEPGASRLDRDHSAARFDEFASRPLTRAVIDGLLDAVSG